MPRFVNRDGSTAGRFCAGGRAVQECFDLWGRQRVKHAVLAARSSDGVRVYGSGPT